MVANAETEPPTVIELAERVVLIVGLDLLTARDAQELIIGLLLASPV
jgi:hypothetical protein